MHRACSHPSIFAGPAFATLFATLCCGASGEANGTPSRADQAAGAGSVHSTPSEADGILSRIEAYLACIDFDCVETRRAVVASGALAVPALLKILSVEVEVEDGADPAASRARRLRAVAVLGEIGDRRALPALADLLEAEDPLLRAEAVRAVGRLAGEGAVVVLAPRLHDADPLVRENAVSAIVAADPQRAEPILRAALTRERAPHIAAAIERALDDIERATAQ